jgi:cytochrome P450
MYNQDDFITWLFVNAPESDRTVDEITRRLLVVNFAAIHTSALNLGHALYWLLARYVARWLSNSSSSPANRIFFSFRPKYIIPLREEIEETVGRLGWTKDAIGQMPKLESFMKECMRMTPLGARE